MAKVRLMDSPADYTRLGVSPDRVEAWEDGRRVDGSAGTWEWWYFDAILDDGTAVVIQFFTTTNQAAGKTGDHPNLKIKITLPDGTAVEDALEARADQSSFGIDACNVRIGPHSFVGDLHDYRIRVEPTNGVGADLTLTSQATPYRPGTAYFGFGDHDERYYTWLCAVPKGEVSGTITFNGRTVDVHGFGYHDHQWGTIGIFEAWNNWLWARQRFDDYTVLVFDMVAREEFGYARFPLTFVQDSDGRIVFENSHNVHYTVAEEYTDALSGKTYPKQSSYTFEHDGKKLEYTLTVDKQLESLYMLKLVPANLATRMGKPLAKILSPIVVKYMSWKFRRNGQDPSYARYAATGDLRLTEAGTTIERSGGLIYEFMYPGISYRRDA